MGSGNLARGAANQMRNRPLPAPLESRGPTPAKNLADERRSIYRRSWNRRIKTEIPVDNVAGLLSASLQNGGCRFASHPPMCHT
jgi:hypothetical protein